VYYFEDDDDPNVYGNQAAGQNDSEVLTTGGTLSKKGSKHRVLMSSGKKDPAVAGKSI